MGQDAPPPPLGYRADIEQALGAVLAAAREAATHADGKPTGRSRDAALRHLRDTLTALDTLVARLTGQDRSGA